MPLSVFELGFLNLAQDLFVGGQKLANWIGLAGHLQGTLSDSLGSFH